jgi:acetoin utilization deacetylase AcuC-like enzyme
MLRTVHSELHARHAPGGELHRGETVSAFECPRRADEILATLQSMAIGPVSPPDDFPDHTVTRVHDEGYTQFLRRAFEEWSALGRTGDAAAQTWAVRGMRSDRVPESLDGRLAYYSFDTSTPITAGTWTAARSAANVALTAARLLETTGERGTFALCRPPGHHAAADYYGGYCFLNNAAIAAQYLRDQGAMRVGILDIDYHHGNGTQSIFYGRDDVPFASIHADPASDYPYFLGYADERGSGPGEGYNRNLPLARGAAWGAWGDALDDACNWLAGLGVEAVVVSLGVDTFELDPISAFRLSSDDYLRVGGRLARLGKPVLFVMEGGYALDHIGRNVANVLEGFADA